MYQVNLSRQDDEVHVLCNCPFFETESACKHIWATILAADEKSYLLGAMGGGGRLNLVEDSVLDPSDEDFEDEDHDEHFPPLAFTQTYPPTAPPPPTPKIPPCHAPL